jgi:hypothetical protein
MCGGIVVISWWIDGGILGLNNAPWILDVFFADSRFGNGWVVRQWKGGPAAKWSGLYRL